MRSGLFLSVVVCNLIVATALATGSTVIPAPPSDVDSLAKMFKDPPPEYRIQFLLRTNDEVTKEDLEYQAHSIAKQGGGGLFAYCEQNRGDSAPQRFLSDWWMNVVDMTARACADAGIMFWVYDEEDWPSGSVGGQLPEKHPEYRWKYLKEETHTVLGGTQASITIPGDDKIFVAAVAYKTDGDKIVIDTLTDLSDRLQADQLKWDVPAGEWTIATFVAVPNSWGWGNLQYPDLMDREATGAFVDWVYKGHYDRVSQTPGVRLVGYFTDEPSLSMSLYPGGKSFTWWPAMPWTPALDEAFTKSTGIDFRKNLPLLYHDSGPESLKYRCRFWETCARLYNDNYFGQIFKFCDERGLIASGHIHVEESLMALLTLQGGNPLAIYRNMHIPGIDWIYPFKNKLPAHVPHYAASMAHLMGRPRTWCESFAACGYGLNFQEICQFVNWEHVNGINMQIPICYKYSLRGPDRVQFYNPGISYQQPYWDHFRAFADYEARLCLLGSGLGHVAQIAIAFPTVDLWAYCWDLDTINARSAIYYKLGDDLRQAGYDYDVFDDEALCNMTDVKDVSLVSPTERFKVLILPHVDVIRRSVLRRANKLADAGGIAIVLGGLPRHSMEAGYNDPEVKKLVEQLLGSGCYEKTGKSKSFWAQRNEGRAGFAPTPQDVITMLSEALPPDLQIPAGNNDLCAHHRRLDDADLYLILNRKPQQRTVSFTLTAIGQPEKWNPLTGKVEPVDAYEITPQGTHITLSMAADELTPIVIRPGTENSKHTNTKTVLKEIPIAGPFAFHTEQTMNRPHVAWNFSQVDDGWTIDTNQPVFLPTSQPADIPTKMPLGDWCEHGLSNYSGLGHYKTDITTDAIPDGAQMILDLGKVAVSAEIKVNGQSAGIVFCDPYRLDITNYVKPGVNHLEIVVANTLANYYSQFKELANNQLWQGGVEPEDKVSGLLGPVVLQIVK